MKNFRLLWNMEAIEFNIFLSERHGADSCICPLVNEKGVNYPHCSRCASVFN